LLPKYVKRVRSKGKVYYYFDTGKRVDGKKVYTRLPDLRDPGFGGSYAALMGHRNRGRAPDMMRMPKLIGLFERSAEYAKLSDATKKVYGIYLTRLAHQMPTAPAAEVTRGHMQRLLDKMAETPGAMNATLRAAGSMFSWARAREYVTSNPCDDISPIKGNEHPPWPEPILQAALASNDPNVRLLSHMLYYTAQRIGDVVRMRWSDFAGGRVRIRTGKTKADLDIPQHTALRAVLQDRPRDHDVICTRDGKPMDEAAARHVLQTFTAGLGVKTVPHGLRKNAVNALLEAGCTVAQTAAVSRQSLQMVEHYARKRDVARLADDAFSQWENAPRTYKTVENGADKC
jgi:integrase